MTFLVLLLAFCILPLVLPFTLVGFFAKLASCGFMAGTRCYVDLMKWMDEKLK